MFLTNRFWVLGEDILITLRLRVLSHRRSGGVWDSSDLLKPLLQHSLG